jgi:hypothetical protein
MITLAGFFTGNLPLVKNIWFAKKNASAPFQPLPFSRGFRKGKSSANGRIFHMIKRKKRKVNPNSVVNADGGNSLLRLQFAFHRSAR